MHIINDSKQLNGSYSGAVKCVSLYLTKSAYMSRKYRILACLLLLAALFLLCACSTLPDNSGRYPPGQLAEVMKLAR